MLWYDENYDGIRDSGEAGIANYPVYLYKSDDKDNALQTVATDANGDYKFTELELGTYVVGVKSNELGTDYYLLPTVSVTGDNKLGTWSKPMSHGQWRQIRMIGMSHRHSTGNRLLPLASGGSDWK